MKNLAELSQHDELITHMKDIAAHVLSADNMRLLTSLDHDVTFRWTYNYILTLYVI